MCSQSKFDQTSSIKINNTIDFKIKLSLLSRSYICQVILLFHEYLFFWVCYTEEGNWQLSYCPQFGIESDRLFLSSFAVPQFQGSVWHQPQQNIWLTCVYNESWKSFFSFSYLTVTVCATTTFPSPLILSLDPYAIKVLEYSSQLKVVVSLSKGRLWTQPEYNRLFHMLNRQTNRIWRRLICSSGTLQM